MDSNATQVIWRRRMYSLTPQLDIYKSIRKVVKDKNVLEFGFCTGAGVLQYCGVAKKVLAVEIDKSAIKFAETMFPIPNVRWDYGNIEHPQYRNFDVVIAIEVIEHVENIDNALNTIRRALTPSGFAIITTPNRNRYRARDEDLITKEFDPFRFYIDLREFFYKVWIVDSNLDLYGEWEDTVATKETPIIAVVTNAR